MTLEDLVRCVNLSATVKMRSLVRVLEAVRLAVTQAGSTQPVKHIVRLVAMEMIVSRRAEIVRSVPVTLRLDSVMGDVLRGGKGLGVNQAVLMGSMERIALRPVGLV